MDRPRRLAVRLAAGLALAVGLLASTPSMSRAQLGPGFGLGGTAYGNPGFGVGYGGAFGGFGSPSLGGVGYPASGYAGLGGYPVPGYGLGYGGYGGYGYGFYNGPGSAFFPAYPGMPLYGYSGYGSANPYFALGTTPLAVQSALGERYFYGRTAPGSYVRGYAGVAPTTGVRYVTPGAGVRYVTPGSGVRYATPGGVIIRP